MAAAASNERKPWRQSRKFRCACIATLFPLLACLVWLLTGDMVPTALVGLCMTPWVALGGGETWHDNTKLAKGD